MSWCDEVGSASGLKSLKQWSDRSKCCLGSSSIAKVVWYVRINKSLSVQCSEVIEPLWLCLVLTIQVTL